MTAEEVLSELEARRVELAVAGDRLRFRPARSVPDELLAELREHKAELIELVSLRGWPEASRRYVRRLRRPEARLCPFVGRRVVTPLGEGQLLEVVVGRAAVVLDRALEEVSYLLPSEVRPPGLAHLPGELFEAVN